LERYRGFDEINRPYLSWQIDQFRPHLGKRILEVGCGLGGIVELLEGAELLYGIDVQEDLVAYAAQRCASRPECRFAVADVADLSPEEFAELKSQRFDTAVAINVLEHVRDDAGALRNLERLLEPAGTLALLVPAHSWLYGPYDRADGHYRRYSKARLRRVLLRTGFRPVKMHYFNAPGALAWWVRYRLLRKSTLGRSQLGAMTAVLPVVKRIERLAPPPFGLSLIAVCGRLGDQEEAAPAALEDPCQRT